MTTILEAVTQTVFIFVIVSLPVILILGYFRVDDGRGHFIQFADLPGIWYHDDTVVNGNYTQWINEAKTESALVHHDGEVIHIHSLVTDTPIYSPHMGLHEYPPEEANQ